MHWRVGIVHTVIIQKIEGATASKTSTHVLHLLHLKGHFVKHLAASCCQYVRNKYEHIRKVTQEQQQQQQQQQQHQQQQQQQQQQQREREREREQEQENKNKNKNNNKDDCDNSDL